jgi:Ulp1 family protease
VKGSLERLKPGKWLNDDIINAYISLINMRSQSLGLKKAYIFNTFFYTMIEDMQGRNDYDFKKLMRIINRKKVNLLDYEYVLIPVNQTHYHWYLLSINLRTQTFDLIDSMTTAQETLATSLSVLQPFLHDYLTATQIETPQTSFKSQILPDVPKQQNGSDCGLFTCLNMELLARVGTIGSYSVDQEFSNEARKRLSLELLFGEIIAECDD